MKSSPLWLSRVGCQAVTVCLLHSFLASSATAVNWTHTSTMDVLPGDDGWDAQVGGELSQTITGGVLHLVDDNLPDQEYVQYWDYFADPEDGITVEMRIKVNSHGNEPWGNDFAYGDGIRSRQLNFMTDGIRDHWASQVIWNGDLSDDFHTIWISFEAGVDGLTSLWVDGDFVDSFAQPAHANAYGPHVFWGNTNWLATGDFEIDYLRYSTDGAFAAPEPGSLALAVVGMCSMLIFGKRLRVSRRQLVFSWPCWPRHWNGGVAMKADCRADSSIPLKLRENHLTSSIVRFAFMTAVIGADQVARKVRQEDAEKGGQDQLLAIRNGSSASCVPRVSAVP